MSAPRVPKSKVAAASTCTRRTVCVNATSQTNGTLEDIQCPISMECLSARLVKKGEHLFFVQPDTTVYDINALATWVFKENESVPRWPHNNVPMKIADIERLWRAVNELNDNNSKTYLKVKLLQNIEAYGWYSKLVNNSDLNSASIGNTYNTMNWNDFLRHMARNPGLRSKTLHGVKLIYEELQLQQYMSRMTGIWQGLRLMDTPMISDMIFHDGNFGHDEGFHVVIALYDQLYRSTLGERGQEVICRHLEANHGGTMINFSGDDDHVAIDHWLYDTNTLFVTTDLEGEESFKSFREVFEMLGGVPTGLRGAGKKTIVCNGRKYKVHMGKRGGQYIVVDGKKKYV